MKKYMQKLHLPAFIFVCTILASACVKDVVKKTYTYYEPVLKLKTEVLQEVKSTSPVALTRTGKIVLYNNYIFINEVKKGIHIIDNSNPAAPINKAFIAIPGNVDLAIKDNVLYADIYTDFIAIDISNPLQVSVSKKIGNLFSSQTGFYNSSADSTHYIVDWTQKTTTDEQEFKAQEKTLLVYSSSLAGNSGGIGINGSTSRFCIVNNYLYAIDKFILNAIDISNSKNPVVKQQQSVAWNIETVYPLKDKLFIGGQTGMYIYDLANPAAPKSLGAFTHACFRDPVIADGQFAFVTLKAQETPSLCRGTIAEQKNELDVIDISNLGNPALKKVYDMKEPQGLSKDGNLLFICDGKDGLKIYDATNPLDLKLIKKISDINPFEVIASDKSAIVVAKEGLYQYDYSIPSNLKLISKIAINK